MSQLHIKVRLKIEQIARLRMQGLKDQQIMDLIGLTQGGFSRIISLQEYKDTQEAIFSGHVTALDEHLADNREALREAYKCAVPAAMRTLLETVVQRRDLKAAIMASKEILNRDPQRTFAEASRESAAPPSQTLPSALLASIQAEGDKVAKELSNAGAKARTVVIPSPDPASVN